MVSLGCVALYLVQWNMKAPVGCFCARFVGKFHHCLDKTV